MTCPYCNNNNDETANYCIYCGANLKKFVEPQTEVNNEQLINSNKYSKKLNKQKITTILIIAIVVIVAIITILLINNRNKNNSKTNNNSSNNNYINTYEDDSNLIFESDVPIRFEKDGKYGFMDLNGNIIIEPIYKYANEFEGEYSEYTYVTYDDSPRGYGNTKSYLIDRKGNIVAEGYDQKSLSHLTEYNIWIIKDQIYNEELIKITPDDIKVYYEGNGYFSWKNQNDKTVGIMNYKGEITYKYQLVGNDYSFTINPSDNNQKLKDTYGVAILNNNKYAIINLDTGKIISDYNEKYISCENNNIFEISNNYNFESRIYVYNDQVLYKTTNKSSTISYNQNYIEIYDSDERKNIYINSETGEIKDNRPEIEIPKYTTEWEIYTKIESFKDENGYGLKNDNGIIIPSEWDRINILMDVNLYKLLESFEKKYIMAEKDGKSYLLNLENGKTVAILNTTYIHYYHNSPFIYYLDEDSNKNIIYNLITGKSISTESDSTIIQNYNSVIVENNNTKEYYNMNMKLIYTEE